MDIFLAKLSTFGNALPGDITQGLIWGIMAIGVFITYKILDFADLTVDGTLGLGGVVAVVLISNGVPVPVAMLIAFLAGCAAGLCTALLNTMLGIPGILAGILTQLALYSVYLDINGKANAPVSVDKFPLVISSRYVTAGNEVVDIIRTVGTALLFVVLIISSAVLVLRNGIRHGYPRHRPQLRDVKGGGYQHQAHDYHCAGALQRHGRSCGRAAGSVSGLRRRKHGQRRHRNRSCGCNYRHGSGRGYPEETLQLHREACVHRSRRYHLLRSSENSAAALVFPQTTLRCSPRLSLRYSWRFTYLQKTSKTSFRRAAKRSAGAAASAAAAESEHFGQVMQNSVTGKKEDK